MHHFLHSGIVRTPDFESSSTESEDDLPVPSCGFKLVQNSKPENSKSDGMLNLLDIDDVLARRQKEDILFAQISKLDENFEEEIKIPKCGIEERDEDVQYILDSAQEMVVLESTVKKSPHYTLWNPDCSLTFFNCETLKLANFLSADDFQKYPNLVNIELENILIYNALQAVELSKEVNPNFGTFFLYLMSVHPVKHIAEMCHNVLHNKPEFIPSHSHFIQIFQNWGYELNKLYKTVPDIKDPEIKYTEKPKSAAEPKIHNFFLVFRFMKHLSQIHPNSLYYHLIEPLMRMLFDVKVYDSSLMTILSQIIILLIVPISKSSKNISVSVKDIHIKDFCFQRQTIMCTKILRYTSFCLPLGYSALQQFLGCPNTTYCQTVNVENLYDILIKKTSFISKLSYLDLFCCLQIVEMFLCHKEIIDGKIQEQVINFENWHDLFHNWTLLIAGSEDSADIIYVKEKIAQVQYQLRMRQVIQIRKHRDLGLQTNFWR